MSLIFYTLRQLLNANTWCWIFHIHHRILFLSSIGVLLIIDVWPARYRIIIIAKFNCSLIIIFSPLGSYANVLGLNDGFVIAFFLLMLHGMPPMFKSIIKTEGSYNELILAIQKDQSMVQEFSFNFFWFNLYYSFLWKLDRRLLCYSTPIGFWIIFCHLNCEITNVKRMMDYIGSFWSSKEDKRSFYML